MLKCLATLVGVLSLGCSPVFAQSAPAAASPEAAQAEQALPAIASSAENALSLQPFALASFSSSRIGMAELAAEPGAHSTSLEPVTPIVSNAPKSRFHWKPALAQSAHFLFVMHAFRLATEPSTRSELRGPFFGDYADSILGASGWGDSDPFMVNYIGHPLEGSVAGYIYLQNDDVGRTVEFGKSKAYWHSRLKATAWSAAFSLQFELGPISEASIGNVGKLTGAHGETYMGAVDLVVTPIMGLGWMVAEDSLDKYAIRGVERRTDSRVLRALARGFLNPTRSMANMMRWKAPWYRDNRPLEGSVVAESCRPCGRQWSRGL